MTPTNSNRGEGYEPQPGRFDSLDRVNETPADLPERLASQLGTALGRDAAIDSPPKPTHHSGTDLPAGLITRQTHSPTEPGGRGVLAIGSLFAGIGGLELGLEWSGLGHTVWQVEMDPFCRRVLAKHWPDADRSVTDVRDAGRATLPPVDLLCGGFPCQDVSSAGKGAGLAGERSGLWYEFRRIVDELRPEWVVVENVASGASRYVDVVVSGLEQLGYQAIPFPLSAADVGAWHRRGRVFVVAHAASQPLGSAGQPRQPGGMAPNPQREPLRQQSGRSGRQGGAAGEAEPRHDGAARDDADNQGQRCGQGRTWRAAPLCEGRQSKGKVSDFDANGKHALTVNAEVACTPSDAEYDVGTRRVAGSWMDWSGSPAERAGWWDFEPDVVRVVHGVPDESHRRRALGNAVVPQCAEVIGWIIRELAGLTDSSPASAAGCSGGSSASTRHAPITARAAGRS